MWVDCLKREQFGESGKVFALIIANKVNFFIFVSPFKKKLLLIQQLFLVLFLLRLFIIQVCFELKLYRESQDILTQSFYKNRNLQSYPLFSQQSFPNDRVLHLLIMHHSCW